MRFRPLLIVSVALSVTPSHAADYKTLIDDMVRPLVEEKFVVACVVGVVDHGEREVYSYGVTRLGGSDKPTGNTVFEIGSMTKAITGTLLADMANRGLVKLDAPLQDFMPKGLTLREVQGHSIRLVDVASQSSGLPRMPYNFAPKDPKNPYVNYSAEDMFAFLREHQLRRPPGEYEYSNLGMGLLGYLLAQKAGMSYEQLLVARICVPLEMNDTRITFSDEQRRRLAAPYNGELAPDCNWELDALAGAGAIHSTANDMLTLLDASLSNDDRPVVAALHEAWKQHYGQPASKKEDNLESSWSHGLPTEHRVGLGWQIAPDGVTRWHNGQTGGYSAVMYVHPPTKKGVVILCNTPTDLIWPLGEKLLQSMRGLKPAPLDVPKTIALAPATLRRYEGVYELEPSETITITLDDGQLMAQMTGQEKHRLYPQSETEFFLHIADAQVSFVRGDDGQISRLVLHQNGNDMPAPRIAPMNYGEQLEPFITKAMHHDKTPGLVIGIVQEGRLVYAHGFGVMKQGEDEQPVTPETIFHMASVTKPIVGASVMQLVEQRRVDLDSPVTKYLPYFTLKDESYASITVRHLLTHTSGMPDVEDYQWDKPEYDDGSLERHVRGLRGRSLLWAPGTKFAYSNLGYEVLGDLVAKVSGKSFEDYVQENIFTPLNMTSSTLLLTKADPARLATGYTTDDQGRATPVAHYPYNRRHTPSSNLHSNVVDMARWMKANMNRGELDGRRVLKSSTFDEIWSESKLFHVGISWFFEKQDGHQVVWHNGSDTGFQTLVKFLPARGIGVVVMANSDQASVMAIGEKAFHFALVAK